MSKIYDNWGRLVVAVLRRDKDRQLAFLESPSSSGSADSPSSYSPHFISHSQLALQKIVFKVYMNNHKSRTKALQIAASLSGIKSVAIGGEEMDLLQVVGGFDPVELIRLLRKKIGHAELLIIRKAMSEGAQPQPQPQPLPMPMPLLYIDDFPSYQFYEARDQSHAPSCTIL